MKQLIIIVCIIGSFWLLMCGESRASITLSSTGLILLMMPNKCKCSEHKCPNKKSIW